MKRKEPPENLLDLMGCEYIPAVFTGDREKDNKSNTELYLYLVDEGKTQGYCPVLVDKEIKYNIWPWKYGYTDSKEDYPKVAKRLIEIAEDSCFSVWLGRLIFNYYQDCQEYEDDVENDLNNLIPPDTQEYIDRFPDIVLEKDFVIGEDNSYKPYDFSYENHVFALVPVKNPWEVLAWVPMGGFNWCPDPVHQVALAKGLYEQFGARIMYISSVSLEYYLPEALAEKEDIEKAAKILIAADSDIYNDYETTAEMIIGSHIWRLWWD